MMRPMRWVIPLTILRSIGDVTSPYGHQQNSVLMQKADLADVLGNMLLLHNVSLI
jgi:hypothetical protein